MSVFGITPGQVAQIAADWKTCGASIADVRVTPPPGGSTSRVVAACVEFCAQARRTATTEADRLTGLGDALSRFDALTSESDRASASALGVASAKGPR
ncbi:hypothetical protein nbrc107696_14140 [Gordonia spumicola]|uniref:Uncharacterized protein n=1 Tax=Gordonia spumicola TaxID=589161 RepID=A0A7I9V6H9_9ACTN|nr:hypothetical protein [Gordonia spumicola]GEE00968.1 hypothetical protein nbrc107696_14140 [Gordonia spumicola]